jgi:hypothetical protein
MLDADGSTDPAEIPAFIGVLLAGANFVKGSRFLQGGGTSDMPLYRRWGNAAFVSIVRRLFGGSYSDLCYGYNAFWAWTVPRLRLNGGGFEIETQMNVRALQAGFKVAEVPSFEAKRVYGRGRLRTLPDGWRVFKAIWREWISPNPPWAERRPGGDRRRASGGYRGPERRSGCDRRVTSAPRVCPRGVAPASEPALERLVDVPPAEQSEEPPGELIRVPGSRAGVAE